VGISDHTNVIERLPGQFASSDLGMSLRDRTLLIIVLIALLLFALFGIGQRLLVNLTPQQGIPVP
jgi:hypothetical protein